MSLREFIQLRIVALSDRDRYSAKVINGFLPLPTGSLLLTVGKKTALVDQTGKLLHFTEKLVFNDLDEHLKTINLAEALNNRTFCVSNNYLYILVNVFHFFEEENKPPFKELTDDSNPVIVRIKLKPSNSI